ncbi:group II intron maturase-specific domain-containing protein [Mycobacterium pseudokansasii]|uniref:group II intron maturase-specific domain-containing protein n=1 Tax=Mycobacterium pseudokansasii TaxID=2341080 RepID=UPI001FE853C5|nr:group II intron maturase-specific domain-containing protein [Mycobacterium pseudokansasii]
MKRIRARLTTEMRALRGHNAQMVLIRLNPIIRGWSAYYRHCVSARVFNALDNHVWKLTDKWARFTHPHKGRRWIVSRYFGAFHPSRRDLWVFGDRDTAPTGQVRLDGDHPAHPGQGLGVPGRPCLDRLLGDPAPPRETPAGPGPVETDPHAARTLPALRPATAAR